jgi:hypothetical protein
MIKEHLLNPEEFGGEWMIPSITMNDPIQNQITARTDLGTNEFLVYLGLKTMILPKHASFGRKVEPTDDGKCEAEWLYLQKTIMLLPT